LQVLLSQNPAMVGTLQVRRLQLRGRTLTVSTEESMTGQKRVHRLQWQPAAPPAARKARARRKATGAGKS